MARPCGVFGNRGAGGVAVVCRDRLPRAAVRRLVFLDAQCRAFPATIRPRGTILVLPAGAGTGAAPLGFAATGHGILSRTARCGHRSAADASARLLSVGGGVDGVLLLGGWLQAGRLPSASIAPA